MGNDHCMATAKEGKADVDWDHFTAIDAQEVSVPLELVNLRGTLPIPRVEVLGGDVAPRQQTLASRAAKRTQPKSETTLKSSLE